ncbi:MAG: DUF4922 domain-containing protein [Bacteroidales bacterium]
MAIKTNTIEGADAQRVENLFVSQLRDWKLAGDNYRDLEKVMTRTLLLEAGRHIRIQYNPARMISSAASVDKKSVSERPCFLCSSNLPVEQKGLDFNGRYKILVNPFPIFPRHLTIPLNEHVDQLIAGRFSDMLELAEVLEGFTVFYNGPRCGASAPDHFHFQAGNKGFMPVEQETGLHQLKVIDEVRGCRIMSMERTCRNSVVLSGMNIEVLTAVFNEIYNILHSLMPEREEEPMINILAYKEGDGFIVCIFPRKAHRPAQFFEKDEGRILISPASVDFGGVMITPRFEDYEKLDTAIVKDIFRQVTMGIQEWDRLISILEKTDF